MKNLFTCLVFLLFSGFALSQNLDSDLIPAVSLQKAQDDWFSTKEYPEYPQAKALVLYDQGELHFESLRSRLNLLYHYSRVVKILDEKGLNELSEIRIPIGPDETLLSFIGASYRQFHPDAPAVKIKITRDMIEDVDYPDGSKERIIRVPKLVVGSVISYAWAIATENYSRIRPWDFQQIYPVEESHFITHVPQDFILMALLQGELGSFKSKESVREGHIYFKTVRSAQLEPRIQATATGLGAPVDIKMTDYSMTKVEALRPRPLVGAVTDIKSRMLFQIQGMSLPSLVDDWSVSWSDLTSFLKRHSRLGALARGKQVVKNWLKEEGVDVSKKPNRVQLARITRLVQESIDWNERFDVLGSMSSRDLLRDKFGNSADVNLLLASALETVGFKVTPLLTCTRSHGRLMERFPVVAQFNHLVLEVKLKGQPIYVDASQSRLPLGLLPLYSLRDRAMRLNPRKANWETLGKDMIRHRHTLAFFELDPQDGVIEGQLRHLDRGYSAIKTQELLANYENNLEAYFTDEMLAEFPAANMGNHIVKTVQRGEEEVISTRVQFVTRDYITQGDSLLLIEPLLSESYPENPLDVSGRNAPIDFGSPIKEEFILLLTIPEGYEFAVIPESTAVAIPHGYGRFIYKYQIVNRTLQLLSRIQITRGGFPPSYRQTFSEFFDHIAAKHGERVIIRKSK